MLRSLVLVPLGIIEGSGVADWAEWYRGPDDVPQHIQNLVDEFAPKVLELTESFKNVGVKLEVISAARYVQRDFP